MSENTVKNRRTIYLPDELAAEIEKDMMAQAVKSGKLPTTLSAWMQEAAREKLGLTPEEAES